MSILEVKNLKKNFGSLEVLKGIDFSLEKGEALAMIGASGSGKTTLLRCLNFLERPTHGQIIVNDKVIFEAMITNLWEITDKKEPFTFWNGISVL